MQELPRARGGGSRPSLAAGRAARGPARLQLPAHHEGVSERCSAPPWGCTPLILTKPNARRLLLPSDARADSQRGGPGTAQDKSWHRANKASARPSAAHQARSCGSLSTSYAAWINLNCSAASSAFSRFLSARQLNETASEAVRLGGSSRPAAPGTEPGDSAVPPRREGPGPGPGRTRVPAQRQPAVRPLQLLLGGVAPHAQHLVVALHGDGGGGRRGGDTGTPGTAAPRREGRGRQREERGGRGGP